MCRLTDHRRRVKVNGPCELKEIGAVACGECQDKDKCPYYQDSQKELSLADNFNSQSTICMSA